MFGRLLNGQYARMLFYCPASTNSASAGYNGRRLVRHATSYDEQLSVRPTSSFAGLLRSTRFPPFRVSCRLTAQQPAGDTWSGGELPLLRQSLKKQVGGKAPAGHAFVVSLLVYSDAR